MLTKKIKIYLGIFACALSLTCVAPSSVIVYAATNEPDIEVCSDILEWVYKVEDGKVYKRLYNSTEGHWEGDWIYVADVE